MHKMYSLHHGHQLGIEIEVRGGKSKKSSLNVIQRSPGFRPLMFHQRKAELGSSTGFGQMCLLSRTSSKTFDIFRNLSNNVLSVNLSYSCHQ